MNTCRKIFIFVFLLQIPVLFLLFKFRSTDMKQVGRFFIEKVIKFLLH